MFVAINIYLLQGDIIAWLSKTKGTFIKIVYVDEINICVVFRSCSCLQNALQMTFSMIPQCPRVKLDTQIPGNVYTMSRQTTTSVDSVVCRLNTTGCYMSGRHR